MEGGSDCVDQRRVFYCYFYEILVDSMRIYASNS